MFYGSLPEKSAIVKIPDVHVTAFVSLLRYMCCIEAIIDKSIIKETLYAADKYDVIDLKQAIGILVDNETVYEVIDYLTSTQTGKNLMSMMKAFLKSDADFLKSKRFLNLLPSSVQWIVSIQDWQVNEMQLWNRCVDWTSNQCNKKGISKPKDYHLRIEMLPFLRNFCFPSMTASDFATGPADSGILNWKEVQDVYKFQHGKSNQSFSQRNGNNLFN